MKIYIPQERIDAFNAEIQKGEDDILAGRYSDANVFFEQLIAEDSIKTDIRN